MKFNLTANDMQRDGFKLSVQADNPDEMAIVEKLTKQLIDKITVIEIKQGGSDDGMY